MFHFRETLFEVVWHERGDGVIINKVHKEPERRREKEGESEKERESIDL